MLSFDLRALEAKAVQVAGQLSARDPVWGEDDLRPADAVHVTGRLSTAGSGRFYFSGHMSGHVDAQCRRCLAPTAVDVHEALHLLFAEEGVPEADEPDVYPIPARANTLDLRLAIREQWVLAAPAFALCREDCKGLCPRCGADLNAGPCSCEGAVDPRWNALRSLRGDA
ncbi:MAG: YceD family protein [Gemmatimonadaceae bacterium]